MPIDPVEVRSKILFNNPSVNTAISGALSLVPKAGLTRAALHQEDPERYELYNMELQVLDLDLDNQSNVVKASFNFPILPESFSQTDKYLTNVQKTFTSVFTTDNFTFSPKPINLKGTFGINHKAQVTYKSEDGSTKLVVLTGYGLVKRLQKLIKIAHSANDKGNPYVTVFINNAFGEIFVVEILSCTVSQSTTRNGMFEYDIPMMAVRGVEDILNIKDIVQDSIKSKIISSISNPAATAANFLSANLLKIF